MEVLGLRFADVRVADRRLAVVEGKGGHHRIVPAANRFFEELGGYLHGERPQAATTDQVFVVLKGPRRGMPLSAEGLDEILDGARHRAGLEHAICHELRRRGSPSASGPVSSGPWWTLANIAAASVMCGSGSLACRRIRGHL